MALTCTGSSFTLRVLLEHFHLVLAAPVEDEMAFRPWRRTTWALPVSGKRRHQHEKACKYLGKIPRYSGLRSWMALAECCIR